MKLFHVSCMIFLSCLFYTNAYSQKLPFQGRLLQNGAPVNGDVSIIFSIDTVWTETHEAVTVSEGLYDVVLGSIDPLPSDLFHNSFERELNITIEGTPLTPVTIYAAITNNSIQRKLVVDADQSKSDTAIYFEILGGSDSTSYTGVLSTGNSIGTNVGVRGNALSTISNANFQVGTWGRAAGEGSAYHYGVIGQAVGKGQRNMGLYGVASGAGNGSTSLDSGSYNQGVFGVALNNAWGNVGVYGEASGTVGSDNIGVVGWSFAGNETTDNKGILGWAKGTGINKGVYGIATGGIENWAGWFEGNVALIDTTGIKRVQINSNSGSILGRGTNQKSPWSLAGIGNGGNYGSLMLRDSSNAAKVWGQVPSLADGRGYGLLTIQGPSQGAIQGGFKAWEADSLVNLPWLTFEGNVPNKSMIWMEVISSIETGIESGNVRFETTEDGRNLVINPSEMIFHGPNKPNIQIGAKIWESPDLGMIAIKDSTWGNLVGLEASINDNGQLFGQGFFHTNQDPRNINVSSQGYIMNGPLRQAMGIGFQDWSDSNLAYLHMYDSVNSPLIALEPKINGSSLEGTMELRSSLDNRNAIINANTINLNGPTSRNVEIGSASWDEANGGLDRGIISIRGPLEQTLIHMRGDYNGALGRNVGYLEVTDELYDGFIQLGMDTLSNLKVGMNSNQTSVELRGNGDIYHSGQIFSSSDKRFKENIASLTGSLHNTLKMRGVSYSWKDRRSNRLQIGLIAQEVETIYPEFVTTNEDGYKSVNYASMVAVLIEAVKELNSKIEKLEEENDTLSSENTDLKKQLDSEMASIKNRLNQIEASLKPETAKIPSLPISGE